MRRTLSVLACSVVATATWASTTPAGAAVAPAAVSSQTVAGYQYQAAVGTVQNPQPYITNVHSRFVVPEVDCAHSAAGASTSIGLAFVVPGDKVSSRLGLQVTCTNAKLAYRLLLLDQGTTKPGPDNPVAAGDTLDLSIDVVMQPRGGFFTSGRMADLGPRNTWTRSLISGPPTGTAPLRAGCTVDRAGASAALPVFAPVRWPQCDVSLSGLGGDTTYPLAQRGKALPAGTVQRVTMVSSTGRSLVTTSGPSAGGSFTATQVPLS